MRKYHVFIESLNQVYLNEIPKEINISGQTFAFLGTTLHIKDHFIGLFQVDKEQYIIDDIGQTTKLLEPFNLIASSKRNSIQNYYDQKTSVSIFYKI